MRIAREITVCRGIKVLRPSGRRLLGVGTVVALALLAAVMLGVGLSRDPSVVPSVLLDKPAPSLRGATLDGRTLDLRSYRDKVVLVNMWASWCTACRGEHPVLVATQRAYAGLGLQIIGVDMRDTLDGAREFLATMGAYYPTVRDPTAQIAIAWGTFGIPETYVVDRTGKIREKGVGPVTTAWVDAHVVPLLAK
jgi:cytochrome c biogenesis protein CcmG/thiol:disulfide interchange protein DsbE